MSVQIFDVGRKWPPRSVHFRFIFVQLDRVEVVDAAGGEDDVGAGVQNLHDPLFRDVGLAVSDFLEFFRIGDEDLVEKFRFIFFRFLEI